jgi:hypothetical protein
MHLFCNFQFNEKGDADFLICPPGGASLDASLFCFAGKLVVGRLSGTALTFCNFLVKQKIKKKQSKIAHRKNNTE